METADEELHHHWEGAGRAEDQRLAGGGGTADRGAWDRADWIAAPDGKPRRTEPGLQLLADGSPARSRRLRAYGNEIVPQVGAAFVSAFLESV
jgi:hypothetical protein